MIQDQAQATALAQYLLDSRRQQAAKASRETAVMAFAVLAAGVALRLLLLALATAGA